MSKLLKYACILLLAGFGWTLSAEKTASVLLLSSYETYRLWPQEVIDGYLGALHRASPTTRITVCDLNSSPEEANRELAEAETGKYNLITALDAPAVERLLKLSPQLPPEVKLVCLYNPLHGEFDLSKYPNATGIGQAQSALETLRLGLKLFPKTTEICVVSSGSKTGDRFAAKIREQLREEYPQYKHTILSGNELTTEELLEQLRRLSSNTLILYTYWNPSTSTAYPLQRAAVMTAADAASRIPIMVLNESLIGYGPLGGVVTDARRYGREAAELTIKLLRGASPREIPFRATTPQIAADHALLEHYGLREEDFPDSTLWKNKRLDFFEAYRLELMISAFAFTLIAMLLAGLAIHIMRAHRTRRCTASIFRELPIQFGVFESGYKPVFLYGFTREAGASPNEPPEEISDIRQKFSGKMEDTFRTGEVQCGQYTFHGRQKSCRFSRFIDPSTGRPAVFCLTQDIEELHQTRQKAGRAENNLQALLSSLEEAVVISDASGKIEQLNSLAAESAGIPLQQALGSSVAELFHFRAPDGGKIPLPPDSAAPFQGRFELTSANPTLPTMLRVTSVKDAEGVLSGKILTFRDITEEQRIRTRLKQDDFILAQTALIGKIGYFRCDSEGKCDYSHVPDSYWPRTANGEGVPPEEWIHPDDCPAFRSSWQDLLTGKINEFNFDYRTLRDNTPGLYRFHVLSECDESGRFTGCYGVIQDITQDSHMTLERLAMIANEQIINTCLEKIILCNDDSDILTSTLSILGQAMHADGCSLYCAGSDGISRRIAGWPQDPRPQDSHQIDEGHRLLTSWRSDRNSGEQRILTIGQAELAEKPELKQLLERNNIGSLLLAQIRKTGDVEYNAAFEFSVGREFSDTDRLFAEAAANLIQLVQLRQEQLGNSRANEIIMQSLIDTSINPILIFDANGRPLKLNRAASEMTGKREGELLTPEYDIFRDNGDADNLQRQCRETGTPCTVNLKFAGRDYRVTAEPIYDRHGKLCYVVENGYDISEFRKAQDQLSEAMNAALAADRAKSLFLATMSHELRTPLNVVIGFSELLLNGALSRNEQLEYLKSINSAGTALLGLINDILNYSRLESGEVQSTRHETDLGAMFRALAEKFVPAAHARAIDFKVELPPELPRLYLDELHLRQILQHLLSNAVKFTQEGTVTLGMSAKLTSPAAKTGEVVFTVSDTGIGIPADVLEKVWEPFVQNRKATDKAKDGGTGLGLPIVKRLLELVNGEIKLESVENEGSTFTIILKDVEFRGLPETAVPSPVQAPLYANRLMLVVEDIEMNMKLITAMLTKLGANFVTARNAKSALEILRNRDITLILTDVWMPNMTGEEMAELIAADPQTSDVPIIAITADTQVKPGVFCEVLYKPISLGKLSEAIKRAIG